MLTLGFAVSACASSPNDAAPSPQFGTAGDTTLAPAPRQPTQPREAVAPVNQHDTPSSVAETVERGSVEAFSELIAKYTSFDYGIPTDVSEVVDNADLVIVGELQALTAGRRELLFIDEETGSPAFAEYMNLVVMVDSLLVGEMQSRGRAVHVEFAWPSGADRGDLDAVFPRGARLMLAGWYPPAERFDNSEHPGGVAPPNLLVPVPYGLLIEDEDGSAQFVYESISLADAMDAIGLDVRTVDGLIEHMQAAS